MLSDREIARLRDAYGSEEKYVVYNLNRTLYEVSYRDEVFMVTSYDDNGYCIEEMSRAYGRFDSRSEECIGCNVSRTFMQRLIEYAKYVIARIKSIKEVETVTYSSLSKHDRVKILNINREIVEDIRNENTITVECIVNVNETRTLLVYSLQFEDIVGVDRVVNEIRHIASSRLIINTEDKTRDILFANGSFGYIVHEAFGHLVEADYYLKYRYLEKSMRELEKVSEISIVDSPWNDGGGLRLVYDDEGNLMRSKNLFEKGKIKNLLSSTCFLDGKANGNARRYSYQYRAIPRMSNTIVRPDKNGATCLSLVDGIVVNSCLAGSVNYATGEATIYVNNCFNVKNGELEGFINNLVIKTNIIEVLTNISQIGGDQNTINNICEKNGQKIVVATTTPSVLIRGMNIFAQ